MKENWFTILIALLAGILGAVIAINGQWAIKLARLIGGCP